MPVITFASSKGGPGKTTAAVCLSSAWCSDGKNVAVIDADPTRALSRWCQRGQQQHTKLGDVHLIECADDESILETIRSAAASHDYVLVDCAGAAARLLVYAAGAADLVVVPAQPGEADLVEAIKTAKIVQQAADLTGRRIECRVFLNRMDPRTHVGRHAIAQIQSQNLILFESTFGDRVAYREGQYSGTTPILMDPGSPAAHEIATLAREIDTCITAKSHAVVHETVKSGVR